MKPAAFDYLRADSVEAALDALAEHGDEASVLAGGQSLAAMLNMRLVKPRVVVDIGGVAALRQMRLADGSLEVGAAVTQADLEGWSGLPERLPLLAQALPHVGHFQTRNRGTVCGSIAHADPSAELPLCLVALGGEVVLRSRRGMRTLAAGAFATGMLTTARAPDELVVAVRFPLGATRAAFREMAIRHGDFALAAVAAVATGDGVRLAVGGVADRAVARELPRLDGDALDDALNALAWELEGYDDIHASARYRRDLVRRLGREVVREVLTGPGVGANEENAPSPALVVPAKAGTQSSQRHRLTSASAGVTAKGFLHKLFRPRDNLGKGINTATARHRFAFTLNGRPATGEAEPRRLLSDFLRHDMGATGTHVGCEHGVCGSCTVRVDGRAVRSCLVFAVQADGSALETVEGLGGPEGALSVLQEAFRRHHALQCGFCTAGILMTLADFLQRVPDPDEKAVREVLSGNLCRCTGYTNIVRAALDAAAQMRQARGADVDA